MKNIKKIGLSLLCLGIGGVSIGLALNIKKKEELKLAGECMGDIIKEIKLYCKDSNKAGDILSSLHDQLKGNSDYVDCNIVLNDDVVIENNEIIGSVITCTIYQESRTNPSLAVTDF